MQTQKLHLAIDAVGTRFGGAATVLLNILQACVRNNHLKKITVFVSPAHERNFMLPCSDRVHDRCVFLASSPARIHWQLFGLKQALRSMLPDIVLFLANGGIAPAKLPSAVFIQQSLPFSRQAMACLGLGERIRLTAIRWVMGFSSDRANRVLVQSQTMKTWVSQRLKIPECKIHVFPPSVAAVEAHHDSAPELRLMRMAPKGLRVLYVGNTRPYKNLHCLVNAVGLTRKMGIDIQLFLTCPESHPLCQPSYIKGVGYLSQEKLVEAYSLADLLVLPSFVETVGLPMLEAAGLGVPVLAADLPYAHDTCGDAAIFFSPEDPADLAAKMIHILTNHDLKQSLSRCGREMAQLRNGTRPYDALVQSMIDLSVLKK